MNPAAGTPNVQWSGAVSFWSDGHYHENFSEPIGWMDGQAVSFVLRFQARGYAPWISWPIAADARDVKLDVELRPAKSSEVTLYKPDGHVAGNVTVGFISAGARFRLNANGLAPSQFPAQFGSPGSLLRTAANGAFDLPADPAMTGVIAASTDGFAEASPASLRQTGFLQLQPWGRLEVTCLRGDRPEARRTYQLSFRGGAFDVVSFQSPVRVTTDSQGRFLVPELPPGRHQLVREQREQLLFFENWLPGDRADFEIRPGETTKLNLGNGEATVRAHLRWPAEVQRQAQWKMIARLETPMPQPPPGLDKTGREAFFRRAAYRQAFRDQREYPLVPKSGEVLAARDVQPGQYRLNVVIGQVVTNSAAPPPHLSLSLKRVLQATVPVTVPAPPPAGAVDVGNVKLEPAGK